MSSAHPPSTPTTLACLDDLVSSLHVEFDRDPEGAGAAGLLSSYAASGALDWKPYALFTEVGYSRNLVERNAEFELLLLAWCQGERSPIHNHEGQNCWMGVLEGPIEEVHYKLSANGAPEAGPLRTYETGSVAFIRDEIALHDVRATSAGCAVSLHLYAKPFDECNIYCEETGAIERKRLAYHSIRGQLVS